GLTADRGEDAADVDRRAGDGERIDFAGVRVRVPARRRPGRRVDGGDVVAGQAANVVEVATYVDGRAGNGKRVDGGGGAAASEGGARVPARRRPGARVEGGDVVASIAADRGETATDVDGRARDGKRVDLTVGGRVKARVDRTVGANVGDVLARET